jgi:hypothetical protein
VAGCISGQRPSRLAFGEHLRMRRIALGMNALGELPLSSC